MSEVIPLSPAALAGQIHPGDFIEAVDGTPVTARKNHDELLAFEIGKCAPSWSRMEARSTASSFLS